MSPDTRPPSIRPIVSAERIVPAATMSLDWLTLLNEKQKCKIDPAAAVVSEASGSRREGREKEIFVSTRSLFSDLKALLLSIVEYHSSLEQSGCLRFRPT